MSLESLSKQELLTRAGTLVAEERRITAEIICALREIERRRIYLEMGFGSMFDLLTRHFKYSPGAADRRISAMRLSRDVPDVAKSIESGKLSLSTASQVQHFLINEKKRGKDYSAEDKCKLVGQM